MSPNQTKFYTLDGVFTDLKGPEGGDVSALTWSPESSGRLWCGTVSGELYFRDIPLSWIRVEPPFRPMMKIDVLEAAPGARSSILALSQDGRLALSNSNGQSWTTGFAEFSNCRIHVLRHHPLHNGYVLAGTQAGLYFSPDSGLSWARFATRKPLNTVTAIAFDSNDPLTFYVSDTDGFNARVLMTTNGGHSFDPILEGDEYFSQIHTLVFQDISSSLWAAGSGYSWRTAKAVIGDHISWAHIDKGLPVSSITCMTLTADSRIVIGSNGGGLYQFSDHRDSWQRIDIEPRRRYVRCLAASPSGVAAGCNENGVSMENNGEWFETNDSLFARNISRIQRFGDELLVVADEQLFTRSIHSKWKTVPGFQLVQDVLAHGNNCYSSGLYSGVFCKNSRAGSYWEDLKLPVSRATFVRTSSQGDVFVLTHVKRDRLRFYRFCTEQEPPVWKDCSQDLPLSGIVYDFAVDQPEKTLFITISTSRGVFCYDGFADQWTQSQLPESTRVTALYRSRHKSDALYAAVGRMLMQSENFGQTFEKEPLAEFPSGISSLTVSGLDFESMWISTENGGIYVSHFPGCWNALQPEKRSLPINQIAVDTVMPGTMFCGTKGISCWQLTIPSISAHTESCPESSCQRLIYTCRNPGVQIDVDAHILLADSGKKAFRYLVSENDRLHVVTTPKPERITLTPKAGSQQFNAGLLSVDSLVSGMQPAVVLSVPDVFHPVCSIQRVSL